MIKPFEPFGPIDPLHSLNPFKKKPASPEFKCCECRNNSICPTVKRNYKNIFKEHSDFKELAEWIVVHKQQMFVEEVDILKDVKRRILNSFNYSSNCLDK